MIRDLHDSEFRVILTPEQIDVRGLLLADLYHRSNTGAPRFFPFSISNSIFAFRSKRIRHGYIDPY
jgi:hypothetical protein